MKKLILLFTIIAFIGLAQTQKIKDRYFLITVGCEKNNGGTIHAFYTSVGTFPSYKNISEWCIKTYEAKFFIIENIYEFKNKEDFKQYTEGK